MPCRSLLEGCELNDDIMIRGDGAKLSSVRFSQSNHSQQRQREGEDPADSRKLIILYNTIHRKATEGADLLQSSLAWDTMLRNVPPTPVGRPVKRETTAHQSDRASLFLNSSYSSTSGCIIDHMETLGDDRDDGDCAIVLVLLSRLQKLRCDGSAKMGT